MVEDETAIIGGLATAKFHSKSFGEVTKLSRSIEICEVAVWKDTFKQKLNWTAQRSDLDSCELLLENT